MSSLKRPEFLKATGLGTIAGWSVANLNPAEAVAAPPAKWDEETDVAVLGYGGAGAVVSIEAANAGARVLLLEKSAANRHANNTNSAGGLIISPTDVEKAFQYMKACCGGTVDDEMCRTWAELTSQNTAYLKKLADSVGIPSDFLRFGSGEFPDLPGADGVAVYIMKAGPGAKIFEVLSKCVQARKNIRVLYSTPAKKLIQDPNGEVVGVVAERAGKQIFIKARRAVVLTTGGFEFNDTMKNNYLYGNPRFFYGPDCNTGDGIVMAMAVGAQLWHMNWTSQHWGFKYKNFPLGMSADFAGGAKASYIIVDQYGRRYFNDSYNGHSSYEYLVYYDPLKGAYPRIPSYVIFDETLRTAGNPLSSNSLNNGPVGGKVTEYGYHWSNDQNAEIAKGWIMKANTIADLVAAIRARQAPNAIVDYTSPIQMDPATLAATVTTYNGYAQQGKDADFGRPAPTLGPIATPPFYATEIWPVGPNTQGGPKFDTHGRVLDVFDKPIRRLYKAGELGSIYGERYPAGGGNLAELLAFGRVTGQNAAKERPTS